MEFAGAMDFTGPVGGALAMAFGAGCAAGYGFCAQVVLSEFRKVWDERSAAMIEQMSKAEEDAKLARDHFQECDDELKKIQIRVARLEERSGESGPL